MKTEKELGNCYISSTYSFVADTHKLENGKTHISFFGSIHVMHEKKFMEELDTLICMHI